MSNILEDIGIIDVNGTRARIIRIIGFKGIKGVPTVPLNFRNICRHLYGCPEVDFDNQNTVWKSNRERKANYWKSTDILENLESLEESGLVEEKTPSEFVLTDEGRKVYAEIQNCLSSKFNQGEKQHE